MLKSDPPATLSSSMRRPLLSLALAAFVAAAFVGLVAQAGSATPLLPKPPKEFFGIGPQEAFSDEDAAYIKPGGTKPGRGPVSGGGGHPPRPGGSPGKGTAAAAPPPPRHGLRVMPFLYSSPRWIGKETRLPVDG